MTVPGVGGVSGATSINQITQSQPTTGPTTGVDFTEALDSVAKTEQEADGLASQLATGELQDIHQFMAASTKASLAVELTVAVRNRAVEAYQEIMRMQI